MISIDHMSYHTKQAYDDRIRFIVLHYTEVSFKESVHLLTEGNVSAHYLVGNKEDPTYPFEDTRIFQLVEDHKRAWHAGAGAWKNCHTINDSSIGIEISLKVSPPHFPPYPNETINAVIYLLQTLLTKYPHIKPQNIIGHSDLAFMRKEDPGPTFPWEKLYQEGIGAWFDKDTQQSFFNLFQDTPPSDDQIYQSLYNYGYHISPSSPQKEKENATKAFMMHFRPHLIKNTWDPESLSILYALNKKYS